ncbi:MAG: hypothetical protein RMJ67_05705 [Elusimicrobiota bacterium]|nr:hypothetical protein [Endomicrobiia bacterium]MDW8165986.1 hypothetical protein [Elusimicrobiota bacterium]
MGRKSKDKGYRVEHNLERILNDNGLWAKRIPLSGASFIKGDLLIKINGKEFLGEVKGRSKGFKEIYKWIDGKDFLFLKADYKDYLVVITLDKFLNLLGDK